jgi:hypothetical protein
VTPMERIDLGAEELQQLLERARERLSEEEYRKLRAVIDTLEYLTELVADKDTTIRHLRQLLLPGSTEKTKDILAQLGMAATGDREKQKSQSDSTQPQTDSPPGHGRNGVEAYREARQLPKMLRFRCPS